METLWNRIKNDLKKEENRNVYKLRAREQEFGEERKSKRRKRRKKVDGITFKEANTHSKT